MFISFSRKFNSSRYLKRLPKLNIAANNIQFLFSATEFRQQLFEQIKKAKNRIYIAALYLENDEAGQHVMQMLYQVQQENPQIDIKILVDWHRAQRGRIGEKTNKNTNADFYHEMFINSPDNQIPVYGIPINIREFLGVFHLKGFIIDDTLIYSGASVNNVYLHMQDKYRYDRYQLITHSDLTNCMVEYINKNLLKNPACQQLCNSERPKTKTIKNEIRTSRRYLSHANYVIKGTANHCEISLTPLVGLGKSNPLNKSIRHLIHCTQNKLIICTPYFNLPKEIAKDIIQLLKKNIHVEIIVGDKTANDFYIPEDQPFRLIGGLPYLYEINLRRFIKKLQHFIDNELLTIRTWKDGDNSYHLKGIWSDSQWIMITGHNLNPRAWRLDLENAILIHDPRQQLKPQAEKELAEIRENTLVITHYQQIQSSQFYPPKVKRLIKRMRRIRFDRLIRRLL